MSVRTRLCRATGRVRPEDVAVHGLTEDTLARRGVGVQWTPRGDTTLEQIATLLFVTRNTVKSQVRSLYRKLGVSSRADAVAVARAVGLR